MLASFTSIAFSLVFVWGTHRPALMRGLALAMLAIGVAGIAGVLASHWAEPWVVQLLQAVEQQRRP